MCVQVCHENVFSLQFHVEAVQVRSDVREQGKASKPLWVGEVISMGKVLLNGGRCRFPAAGNRHLPPSEEPFPC